jgi:hypothetical protein
MICENCGVDFTSYKWFSSTISNLPICDDCVLKTLEAKRFNLLSDLKAIEEKISRLNNCE